MTEIRRVSTVSCARWNASSRSGERLEPSGEVAKLRRLVDDPIPPQLGPPLCDGEHDFDYVVDVTLRTCAAMDCYAYQVHRRWCLAAVGARAQHHRHDP